MSYRTTWRLGFVALAALGPLACQPLSDGARSKFSQSFTCPVDRVEVRARPDLRPSDWLKLRKPASEVASDPARLTMWRDEQDRQQAYEDGRYRIYEAHGCGHQSLYECARSRKSYNTIWITAQCSERRYLQAMTKW